MGKRKAKKFRPKVGRRASKGASLGYAKEIDAKELAKRERYFYLFVAAVLLAFGIYHSILYFGHQVVPTSDFPSFTQTGHELLSLKLPSSFKRAPVLGLLQVTLSYLVGGQHPELTAGWLLNGLLHPFNLILLWLVGKRIVGRSALWVAIIAIINPWSIQLLTDPIVETTLLFFMLLTFYFIFRRSNWCYLFASITAMVRYEGAALILAAFVMDMIHRRSKRERIRALFYSVIATVPLMLWMVGTLLNWRSEGVGHYLSVLFSEKYTKLHDTGIEARTGVVKHMNVLWGVGFRPLLMPYVGASKGFVEGLWSLSKILATVSFFFGSIYGLCKRKWNILALLILFVPYFLVHAHFQAMLSRYYAPISWIALLICWFGLQGFWQLIDRNGRVPKALVLISQVLAVIIAIIWLFSLIPYLSKISPVSTTSASLPYVTMILAAIIFTVRIFIYNFRHILRELSILSLACLFIVSNQFALVQTIGNGQQNIEFKLLADWYVANAKPGEKLVTTLPHITRIYAPEHRDSFLWLGSIKAESPSDFVSKCYAKNVSYVAWDSRLGFSPGDPYYKMWGLKNIAMLAEPRSIGVYEFITQIKVSKRRFINVFHLRKPSPGLPSK